MKTSLFSLLFLFNAYCLYAQKAFEGTFTGVYNGDNITLTLSPQVTVGANLSGKMKDSEQSYDITANASSNSMQGTAVQTTLGLNLPFEASLSGNQLSIAFDLTAFGTNQKMLVNLTKQGTSLAQTTTSAKPAPVIKGKRDPAIVGSWTKSESYSSGYGDNYIGGTTQSSMTFHADGSLVDGGSRAVVSGSYFGGDTGTSQAKPLEGVSWYSENNNIYLVITEKGTTKTLKLGRYYIENGKMLITGDNGKKELFSKK